MATNLGISPARPSPDVESRLIALGLTSGPLTEAVLAGHQDAGRTTSNDVATRAGYLRWATPLRYLGDVYVPQGWKRERPGGFELLVNPDLTFAIAVAPGDSATGTERMPSTRIERGPLTGQAVAGNRAQLKFGADVHPAFSADPVPGIKICLLLHYHDVTAEEIRVELSLPVEFTRTTASERGHVTAFEPRLILPAIDLAVQVAVTDDEVEDERIDVQVERRR